MNAAAVVENLLACDYRCDVPNVVETNHKNLCRIS